MPRSATKKDFPVSNIRHFLEPGPIVLVSSKWQQQTNIMTMGWHMVMEFSPSLVGCVIASGNYSHDLVRQSGECVINIPSASLIDTVVGIGNCSGSEVNKFTEFDLTPSKATKVSAPLIRECYASFECRLYDDSMIDRYTCLSSRSSKPMWPLPQTRKSHCITRGWGNSCCRASPSIARTCLNRRCSTDSGWPIAACREGQQLADCCLWPATALRRDCMSVGSS